MSYAGKRQFYHNVRFKDTSDTFGTFVAGVFKPLTLNAGGLKILIRSTSWEHHVLPLMTQQRMVETKNCSFIQPAVYDPYPETDVSDFGKFQRYTAFCG